MKRAAFLGRVSTTQQNAPERYGMAAQREAAYAYAKQNDMAVIAEFADVISGASESRPKFYELLARAEEFDAVIVAHIDRIARDAEIGLRHMRLIGEAGLELHSATRGRVETGLLSGVEVLISEEERRSISRRLYGGILQRAEKKLPPLGIKLYGYRNIPKSLPEIDPDAAAQMRRLYAIAAETPTWRETAKRAHREGLINRGGTTHWTHKTVYDAIANPTYKCELIWPRNGKKGTAPRTIKVPAIVSVELWERAQKTRTPGRPAGTAYALSGFLKCGVCGFGFSTQVKRNKDGRERIYYRCNSRGRLEGKCSLPVLNAGNFEPVVEAELRRALSDPAQLTALLREADARRAPDPRLAELRERESRFVEAFGKGDLTPDEFSLLRRQVRAEIAALEPTEVPENYPVDEYREAARNLPLRPLLAFASATIVVLHDGFRIVLRR
jgi:site-specific DNA recombinase